MTTRVEIDPNVRVRGNGTYAGFESVIGDLVVGGIVEVFEAESGLHGRGRITDIDVQRRLVYLTVDWASLTDEIDDSEAVAANIWTAVATSSSGHSVAGSWTRTQHLLEGVDLSSADGRFLSSRFPSRLVASR